MLLLREFILSVTMMFTHMYYLILSPISVEAQLPFVVLIRHCGRHMGVSSYANPLLEDDSVFYGITALQLEEIYQTSRSCIQLRRLNMLCPKVSNVILLLIGGFHLS